MNNKITKNSEGYYIYGDLPLESSKTIAIIGSRRMSKYGEKVLEDTVPRFVASKFVIISGMAPGVDLYSMELALKWGGVAIGILGYGFNHLKDKKSLDYKNAKKLFEFAKKHNGTLCLISPYEPSEKPKKQTFLARNKVIATKADLLLVIEATQKSGVFSTVDAALELGKPVYAVPGDIFSRLSKGTNLLIKQGAQVFDSCII